MYKAHNRTCWDHISSDLLCGSVVNTSKLIEPVSKWSQNKYKNYWQNKEEVAKQKSDNYSKVQEQKFDCTNPIIMRIMRANSSLSLLFRSYSEIAPSAAPVALPRCQQQRAICNRPRRWWTTRTQIDGTRTAGNCRRRQWLSLRRWPCRRSVAVVWAIIAATHIHQTLNIRFTLKRSATSCFHLDTAVFAIFAIYCSLFAIFKMLRSKS